MTSCGDCAEVRPKREGRKESSPACLDSGVGLLVGDLVSSAILLTLKNMSMSALALREHVANMGGGE